MYCFLFHNFHQYHLTLEETHCTFLYEYKDSSQNTVQTCSVKHTLAENGSLQYMLWCLSVSAKSEKHFRLLTPCTLQNAVTRMFYQFYWQCNLVLLFKILLSYTEGIINLPIQTLDKIHFIDQEVVHEKILVWKTFCREYLQYCHEVSFACLLVYTFLLHIHMRKEVQGPRVWLWLTWKDNAKYFS